MHNHCSVDSNFYCEHKGVWLEVNPPAYKSVRNA
jgi:hypothetical protein